MLFLDNYWWWQIWKLYQSEPAANEQVNILARLNPCLSTSVYIKMETVRFEDKYSKTFHYDSSMAVCSNGSFVSSVSVNSSDSVNSGLVIDVKITLLKIVKIFRNEVLVGAVIGAVFLLAIIVLAVSVACCKKFACSTCNCCKKNSGCCNKRGRSVE